ncbi:hypothetical protein [Kocuria sp. KH4]
MSISSGANPTRASWSGVPAGVFGVVFMVLLGAVSFMAGAVATSCRAVCGLFVVHGQEWAEWAGGGVVPVSTCAGPTVPQTIAVARTMATLVVLRSPFTPSE